LQNEFFGAPRFGGNRALIGRNGQANRTSAPAIAQVICPTRLGKNSITPRMRRRQFPLMACADLLAEASKQFEPTNSVEIPPSLPPNEFLPSLVVGQIKHGKLRLTNA
jgi:hypothetical protein